MTQRYVSVAELGAVSAGCCDLATVERARSAVFTRCSSIKCSDEPGPMGLTAHRRSSSELEPTRLAGQRPLAALVTTPDPPTVRRVPATWFELICPASPTVAAARLPEPPAAQVGPTYGRCADAATAIRLPAACSPSRQIKNRGDHGYGVQVSYRAAFHRPRRRGDEAGDLAQPVERSIERLINPDVRRARCQPRAPEILRHGRARRPLLTAKGETQRL